jgi:hypothetical protein
MTTISEFLTKLIANANITTLIVGLITLSGVILSAFISAFVSRRSLYINSVTVERSKWIEKLRNNIAECLGLLGYLHLKMGVSQGEFSASDEYSELIQKVETLLNVITLQLNPDGKIDRNILTLLRIITQLADNWESNYRDAESLLIRHSQWLLKEEWEKVKYESRGLFRRLLGWPRRRWRACRYKHFSDGAGSVARFSR